MKKPFEVKKRLLRITQKASLTTETELKGGLINRKLRNLMNFIG